MWPNSFIAVCVFSIRALNNHFNNYTVTTLCCSFSYSPPHVLRKKLIEEIALNFANPLDPADFYTELFVHS